MRLVDHLKFGRALKFIVVILLMVVCAEITARLDDYMRFQIPVDDESSLEEALKIRDHGITTGRPNGRYQRWKLNEYGFRSSAIDFHNSIKPRVMILGASESFGMYESPGNSYFELLEKKHSREYDFINASIIGMPASAIQPYWDHWLSQFKPNVVIILANPLFYLSDLPPKVPEKVLEPGEELTQRSWTKIKIRSRFLERLKNHLSMPEYLATCIQAAKIKKKIESHPADWLYQNAPEDRLALYKNHVTAVANRVADSGAKVVLLTQPLRVQYPFRDEDYSDLLAARDVWPRASNRSIWEFSEACRNFVVDMGSTDGIETIDLWKRMTGHKKYFADLVHFSDEGSVVVADEVSSVLSRQNP